MELIRALRISVFQILLGRSDVLRKTRERTQRRALPKNWSVGTGQGEQDKDGLIARVLKSTRVQHI